VHGRHRGIAHSIIFIAAKKERVMKITNSHIDRWAKSLADLARKQGNQMSNKAKGCALVILLLSLGSNNAAAIPFEFTWTGEAHSVVHVGVTLEACQGGICVDAGFAIADPDPFPFDARAVFDSVTPDLHVKEPNPSGVFLDRVSVSVRELNVQEVPEPSSVVLLITGAAGLFCVRMYFTRRRRPV
jgi:hypothetical protein